MEILDIAVKHYGKFENYRMAFRPGLNLICGGNETGKSTLHSFLGAMLFGLPRGKGRAARTDEYQLRQPWENPAYFAGEMRIREQGKLYRIRRDFSGHGPSLTILCETEEREEEEPEKFLEEMLGGIREAGFRNTIFVSQGSARTDRGLAGELESFMVNYENSLDERVDVSKALTSLRKKKKEFEQKRKKKKNCWTPGLRKAGWRRNTSAKKGKGWKNSWKGWKRTGTKGTGRRKRRFPEAEKRETRPRRCCRGRNALSCGSRLS